MGEQPGLGEATALEAPRAGGFGAAVARGGVLLADGATGTNYQEMGLPPGSAPEEWLFAAPERVVELHEAFIAAGSDLVLTCSFGASSLRLADGPLAGRARAVNLRAAELARVAARGRALVAGSLGPTGELLQPLGPLEPARAEAAFAEQAGALAEGGVDLLVLETFFALEEVLAAIEGVRSACGLPLVACFSFDQGTRTMMGLDPASAVAAVLARGVEAVGANCGRSLADMDAVVPEILAAAGGTPVWIKPNAGIPRIVGDAVVYDADPATLAAHAGTYAGQGVRVLGGCCGSTPAHIEAIARALGR